MFVYILIQIWLSIKNVSIGIVSREFGPMIFILKGKIKHHEYDDDFIVQHGLKPG